LSIYCGNLFAAAEVAANPLLTELNVHFGDAIVVSLEQSIRSTVTNDEVPRERWPPPE
jgi:hypothetical protein